VAPSLQEFTEYIRQMLHEHCVATDLKTEAVSLNHRSAKTSTFTIVIHYYYSARKLTFSLPSMGEGEEGRRLSWPGWLVT